MGFFCLKCGSMEWKEYYSGVVCTFTVNEKGELKEIDNDYYGYVECVCANCDVDFSLIDYWSDKEEVYQALEAKEGKERIKVFVGLVADGKINIAIGKKELVSKILEIHEDDTNFLNELIPNLVRLNLS